MNIKQVIEDYEKIKKACEVILDQELENVWINEKGVIMGFTLTCDNRPVGEHEIMEVLKHE